MIFFFRKMFIVTDLVSLTAISHEKCVYIVSYFQFFCLHYFILYEWSPTYLLLQILFCIIIKINKFIV